MVNFKKMVLIDYDAEIAKISDFNLKKQFDIQSNANSTKSDELLRLERRLLEIEVKIKRLLKSKKIRNDDKIFYLMDFINKHTILTNKRRQQQQIDVQKLANYVHSNIKKKNDDNDKIINSPKNVASGPYKGFYGIVSGKKSISQVPFPATTENLATNYARPSTSSSTTATTIIPTMPAATAFSPIQQQESDEDGSIYDFAPTSPMDIDSIILKEEEEEEEEAQGHSRVPIPPPLPSHLQTPTDLRVKKKRPANTPLPSVERNKPTKVPKPSASTGIIKTWELRPREGNAARRGGHHHHHQNPEKSQLMKKN